VSFFVTGTDTGVGKTQTAVQLLRLLRASGMRYAGMKPICCGSRCDAELLLPADSEGLTIDEINPVWRDRNQRRHLARNHERSASS
jgi:dethiobiotin synthetase